jgi:methylated-DNA-[protein]-cysteine S-methyltransferase
MKNINIQYYKTKFAEFILGSFEGKLCMVDYRYRRMRTTIDKRLQDGFKAQYIEQDDLVLKQTRQQLQEYFKGDRREFDIPLITMGTDFQKSVWDALLKVPYGTTSTYAQLSYDINNAKAVRAVANANGANSIGIIIPCHRIIGSDGSLTGYAGGLPLKKRLLKLENNLFS